MRQGRRGQIISKMWQKVLAYTISICSSTSSSLLFIQDNNVTISGKQNLSSNDGCHFWLCRVRIHCDFFHLLYLHQRLTEAMYRNDVIPRWKEPGSLSHHLEEHQHIKLWCEQEIKIHRCWGQLLQQPVLMILTTMENGTLKEDIAVIKICAIYLELKQQVAKKLILEAIKMVIIICSVKTINKMLL